MRRFISKENKFHYFSKVIVSITVVVWEKYDAIYISAAIENF